MEDCIDCGLCQDGIFFGGLNVKCCVFKMFWDFKEEVKNLMDDLLVLMDWINFWVMVVNEENVVGGCVVMVFINGVVGIIFVVVCYFDCYYCDFDDEEVL